MATQIGLAVGETWRRAGGRRRGAATGALAATGGGRLWRSSTALTLRVEHGTQAHPQGEHGSRTDGKQACGTRYHV
jgi:hypothetical protein